MSELWTADRDFGRFPNSRPATRSSAERRPTATRSYAAPSPASSRARAKTASIIGSVSRPVNVFCWLG